MNWFATSISNGSFCILSTFEALYQGVAEIGLRTDLKNNMDIRECFPIASAVAKGTDGGNDTGGGCNPQDTESGLKLMPSQCISLCMKMKQKDFCAKEELDAKMPALTKEELDNKMPAKMPALEKKPVDVLDDKVKNYPTLDPPHLHLLKNYKPHSLVVICKCKKTDGSLSNKLKQPQIRDISKHASTISPKLHCA